MNKFKIHYGGTSYVDTYDKNRYKLPHIYRFNPSKIKFYKGISKDEYNDVITFNDDTKFELGNIVPLIQITLVNIQNYYLHKENAEKNIDNINYFFAYDIWEKKNSYIDKKNINKFNLYTNWMYANFKNIIKQKALRQINNYSNSIDFFGAVLNQPHIFIQRILNMFFNSLILRFKGSWAFKRQYKGMQQYIVSARYYGIDYRDFDLEKLIPSNHRANKYIYLKKLVT